MDDWRADDWLRKRYIIIGVVVFVIIVVTVAVCCIRSRSMKARSKEWLQRYKSLMQKSEMNRVVSVTEVAMNDVRRQRHADEDFGPAITRVGSNNGFLRV